MGYSFRLAVRVILYAPSHRQDNTYYGHCYTSRGALAGTSVYTVCVYMCVVYGCVYTLSDMFCDSGGNKRKLSTAIKLMGDPVNL